MTIKAFVASVVTATTISSATAQAPPPRLRSSEARTQVGSVATICGQVVTYHCPRPEMTTFLDLDAPYWSDGVSIRISPAARSLFGPRLEDRFASQQVCATGQVEQRDGRYFVVVDRPDALHIEPAAENTRVGLDSSAVRACDAGVELPKLTHQVKPRYTPATRASRIEGLVLLDGVVLTDGMVGEVRVVHSLYARLDREAMLAFKAWRFASGTQAGHPVPVIVTVQMEFKLQ